ncbi:hypothetical protein BS78_02G370300 [Paspalum vaginatum]|nr:hypothetical protein BS78_02G370300 [Paspalum vaginatum]
MAPSAAVSFLAIAVVASVLQAAAASPPPGPPAPGRPDSCAATLMYLYECVPFLLTGTSLAGPPGNCCSHLREVLATPENICMCHAVGREINELLRINIDPIRHALLPVVCFAIVPPQLPFVLVRTGQFARPPTSRTAREELASSSPPFLLPPLEPLDPGDCGGVLSPMANRIAWSRFHRR